MKAPWGVAGGCSFVVSTTSGVMCLSWIEIWTGSSASQRSRGSGCSSVCTET